MQLQNKTVLVTGANRGIGESLVTELLKCDVKRIYAGARNPDGVPDFNDSRVIPVGLDITDRVRVQALATEVGDVDVLINNAGALAFGSLLTSPLELIQRDLDTNYFGTLNMVRAFAPVIEAKGGAIVNVLTLVSLASMAGIGGYSASKAAAFSLTQAIRAELKARGVAVFGVYPGAVDTDMIAGMEIPKTSPRDVARNIVAGLQEGTEDIFPDPMARQLGQLWATNPKALEGQFATM
jgi:NAD(P)-dependent dehydrogenase (short-subunit alcohol dehydrogenase family)